MYFKLVSKNAYRDLVRNARRIAISQLSDSEKSEAFAELYVVLKDRLFETTRSLNQSPAFADRCNYWNQRDITQIVPVINPRNPWLRFKREFENALQCETPCIAMGKSLAWFYATSHRDDWIAS